MATKKAPVVETEVPEGITLVKGPGVDANGWMVFRVEKVGVNISRRVGTDDYTVWMNLSNPQDRELVVAEQLYVGVGPAPEGSILMIDLEDRLFRMLDTVDSAIDRHIKDKEWS